MGFCKFSGELINNGYVQVENKFIQQYLPVAPDTCVKVYLLGLYRANNTDSFDNTLDNFAKTLNITEEDVESAFLYWQELGLVNLIQVKPFEVQYLPIKNIVRTNHKFNKDKYESFNLQVQGLLTGRMITPTEFTEYYTFLESMHMEQPALVMIIKYCINLKGESVGYPYILTVAKNWAYEGIKTAEQVENKLLEHEQIIGEVCEVLKAINLKRNASFEEKQTYLKWTKDYLLNKDIVLYVANNLKKKGNFSKLDNLLTKYYDLHLTTLEEIKNYETQKDEIFNLAKNIVKILTLHFDNLENIIDVYISKWQNMGYSAQTLKNIAQFCFKNRMLSLEEMDSKISDFYTQGLITDESIDQYILNILNTDKIIKELFIECGTPKNVTSWDREMYNAWIYSWGLSKELIKYACSLAVGTTQPFRYVNKILSDWKNKNIKTVEEAKQTNIKAENFAVERPKKKASFNQRSYSPEEMNALFDNFKEVKW